MTTPQTNTDLSTIAQRMRELNSFVVCGHISPDGDCLGSQLALYHALRSLGKEVTCLLVKAESVDQGLRFLPGIDDMVVATEFTGIADAFVACDVPNPDRMGEGAMVHARCPVTFTIDHHAFETTMSQYNYIDPDAASCTMIVWELIKALEIDISSDMALSAYTGLVTDTGGFQFQNTDSAAFKAASEMIALGISPSAVSGNVFQSRRFASLELESIMLGRLSIDPCRAYALSYLTLDDFKSTGAVKADAEPLINVVRSLEEIKVACILREEEGSVRGSLRAKDDTDVAAIARSFGGGGHKAAAGFTLHAALKDSLQIVCKALDEAVGGGIPPSPQTEDTSSGGRGQAGHAAEQAGCADDAVERTGHVDHALEHAVQSDHAG